MVLESRNAALQSEIDNATPVSLPMRNKDPSSWLPKPPRRYTLESHRSAINYVASYLVSSSLRPPPPGSGGRVSSPPGSRDKTIRLWDTRNTCLLTLVPPVRVRVRVRRQDAEVLGPRGQDGQCVKVVGEPHERFVTSLQWAPSVLRNLEPVESAAADRSQDGEVSSKTAVPRR
ncbi:hypothetical protein F5X97DRAFT_321522 [Nemania serpens]|nr:hypothetical protein F5X97DRAFT_321522 [Nemania serpens]